MSDMYIAIDTETTGLNQDIHVACQLGWVIFDQKTIFKSGVRDIHCSAQEIADASPEALQVNGFTAGRLCNSLFSLEVALNEMLSYVAVYSNGAPCIPVFHNAPFDVKFLTSSRAGAALVELNSLFRRTLDTVSVDFALRREGLRPLKILAETYLLPIEVERWKKHDAHEDAFITARVMQQMLSGFLPTDGRLLREAVSPRPV